MRNELNSRQAGFTLIEVVAAMGIAAIALLGFMKLSGQATQDARSKELDNDFNILASNVQMVLNSDCGSVLPGATYNTTAPFATYSSLVIPVTGTQVAAVGFPTVGMRVTNLQIDKVLSPDIQTPIGTLHQDLVNFNLQAQKYLTPTSTVGQGLIGTQSYSKDFSITVWRDVNTNKLIDCDRQQPVSVVLSAPALTCFPAGSPIGLTWIATGAEGIQITGPGLGLPSSPLPNPSPSPVYAGTQPVITSVVGPAIYTATAYGNSGQNASSSVTLNIQATCPADCSALQVPTFAITPTGGMPSGTPMNLTWTAPGASAVSISPTVGAVPVSGPTTVPAPPVITTYVLTSSNTCGSSAPVSVTVTPQSLCSCGNSSECTGTVTTYKDTCGNMDCQCPAVGTCTTAAPTCVSGNACCSSATNTWTCPGLGQPCL